MLFKKWHFSFKWQYKVNTWKSTTVPSSNSRELVFIWRLFMSQWNASVVTESWIIHFGWHLSRSDEDHVIHATHPTWSHALTESESFVWFDFFFCSHTFVVWVNSLRTVDLTRNVTAGEETGQVNINPDKSTMAGWNFDRIMDTVNMKHHNIQWNPGMGSTNTDTTSAEQNIQGHITQQIVISRRHNIIQCVSNWLLQKHVNSCAVQLLIRLNFKLAQALSHGWHLRMIPAQCLREIMCKYFAGKQFVGN